MKHDKKQTPKVIWETEAGNVTISAIEHGYRFGKCGLRLTRRQNGRIVQNYASYIPVVQLNAMLEKLDKIASPKELLLSFRDTIPAQVCQKEGIGTKGEELKKTFLIAAGDDGKAIIRSTVQWGTNKPHVLEAEITQDDLFNMGAVMESSYRAYQLCQKVSSSGRPRKNYQKGVDVDAA